METMDFEYEGCEATRHLSDADDLELFVDPDEVPSSISEKAANPVFDKCETSILGGKNHTVAGGKSTDGVGNLTFMSKAVYTLVSNIFKCPLSEETLKSNITLSAPKIPFLGLRACDSWLKELNPNITPEALDSEIITQRYISNFLRAAFPLVNLLDGLSKGRVTHSKVETAVTDSLLLLSSALENINCWRRDNIVRRYNINRAKCPEVSPADSPSLFPKSFESTIFAANVIDDEIECPTLPDLEINAVSKFVNEALHGQSSIQTLDETVNKLIATDRAKKSTVAASETEQVAPGSVSSPTGGKVCGECGAVRSIDGRNHDSKTERRNPSHSDVIADGAVRDQVTNSVTHKELSSPAVNQNVISDHLQRALDPTSGKATSTSDLSVTEGCVASDNIAVRDRTDSPAPETVHGGFPPVASSITIEDSAEDEAEHNSPTKGCSKSGNKTSNANRGGQDVIVLKSDEEAKDDEIEILDSSLRKKHAPITGPSPPAAIPVSKAPLGKSPKISLVNSKKQPIRTLPTPKSHNEPPKTRTQNLNDIAAFTGSLPGAGIQATQVNNFITGMMDPTRQRALNTAAAVAGFPMPNHYQASRVIRAPEPYQSLSHAVPIKRPRYEVPHPATPSNPWMEQMPQHGGVPRTVSSVQDHIRRTMRR